MKRVRSHLLIGLAITACTGAAFAKGNEDNPTQVEVLNFPQTQDVAISGTPTVNVSSLPSLDIDDSTPVKVEVTNAPATYSFVGYTDVEDAVRDTELFIYGQFTCRDKFGPGARISTAREMRQLFETLESLAEEDILAILPPIQGELSFGIPPAVSYYPVGLAWFTLDDSINDLWLFGLGFEGISLAKNVSPPEEFGRQATVACSAQDS